jgi:nucleotide-binding universal stress UspA family protein
VNEQNITAGAGVVVGADGTETALRAVAWAATEARVRGVTLRIVHAAPYAASTDDAGCRRAAAVLGRAYTVAHQFEPRVVAHTQRVDEQPVRTLLDAATNADLLVVGMRGEGPGEVVIGSVALAVSGAACCPVTVVRGQRHSADLTGPVLLGLEDVGSDAAAVTAAFADAQRHRTSLIVLPSTFTSGTGTPTVTPRRMRSPSNSHLGAPSTRRCPSRRGWCAANRSMNYCGQPSQLVLLSSGPMAVAHLSACCWAPLAVRSCGTARARSWWCDGTPSQLTLHPSRR